MSFPRYPKYKDSGVEWLGQVPEHWHVTRLKHLANDRVRNGIGAAADTDTEGFPRYVRITDINTARTLHSDTFRSLPPDVAAEAPFAVGDILFACVGATFGKSYLHVVDIGPVCYAGYLAKFSPNKLAEPSFVSYWTASGTYWAQLNANVIQSTVQNFSAAKYNDLLLAAPPMAEQRAIAAFLDRETAKIDALIAEQQRLIELLQEKRQAVISHAVTKGLNPDALMKDSGIEWLGEVPEHWDIGKAKHYFTTCSGGTPNTAQQSLYYAEEGSGYPWVRTTDLNNDLVFSVPVYITDQAIRDTACDVLPKGTVMVAMYGGAGTVGKNGLLMFDATINQAVCGLLPSETHDSEYTFRFMQFYRPYWMIGAESSRKDPNISQESVKNAPFPKPPIEEQQKIVDSINRHVETFNGLLAEAQRTITLLQERRSALISAAVTGQIDVRGLAGSEAG